MTEDDCAVPEEDIEQHWHDMLVGIMAHTVYMCRWLGRRAKSPKGLRVGPKIGAQMANAAVAWNWVFSEPKCELSLSEVCEHLGICEDRVRQKILAESGRHGDINTVVAKVLRVLEVAGPEAQRATRAGAWPALDWAALRESRRLIEAAPGSSVPC